MNRLISGLSMLLLALATTTQAMIQPEFRDGSACSIVSSAPDSAGCSSVSLALSCRNNPIDLTDPLGLADIIGADESGHPIIIPVGDTVVDVRPNGKPLFQSDVNRMAAVDRAHAAETAAAEALARAVEQCQMNLMLQAWGSGTLDQMKIAYLYGLGGMGMRNLNEAFNQQDIFANKQSKATRVLKGVGGIVEVVTTTMPLAKNVTTVVGKEVLAAQAEKNLTSEGVDLATGVVKRPLPPAAAKGTAKPFAMGLKGELDAFAEARGATTWKQFQNPENWRSGVLDKLADPNTPVHFNLNGVDVWGGVQRAASGAANAGATDWELLQIRQNPQFWDTMTFWKNGQVAPNPFN